MSVFPLSRAQQRLLFLADLEPQSAYYNVPLAWRLPGVLAEPTRRMVKVLLHRHPSLRTSYLTENGAPLQRIEPVEAVAIEDIDVTLHTDPERAVVEYADRDAAVPFALRGAPPIRVCIAAGGDQSWLYICVHHIVMDFWAVMLLEDDLRAMVRGGERVLESMSDEPPLSFEPYVRWELGHLTDERIASLRAWWARRLGGHVDLELPADHDRSAQPHGPGMLLSLDLDAEFADGLRKSARELGSTPPAVMAAALAVVLSRWTDRTDVSFATNIVVRPLPELQGIVGFGVNPILLRLGVVRGQTLAEVAEAMTEAWLSGLDHAELPFDELVQVVNPSRPSYRSPLFSVMYTYVNSGALPGEDVIARVPLAALSAAKFDLSVSVEASQDRIHVDFIYARDLFRPATVSAVADALRTTLLRLVDDPGSLVGELELSLSGAGRRDYRREQLLRRARG